MRYLRNFWTLTAAALTVVGAPAAAQERSEIEMAALRGIAAYQEAFNAHDSAAVAARWTEAGVHFDRETGSRTTGRAAIEADLKLLFAESPEVQLAIDVESVRAVGADVVTISGTATVVFTAGQASTTQFSSILVRSGDQWLIDSVDESPQPAPSTARDALQELAWMVGAWQDKSSDVKVTTNVRWGAGESFLVRAYHVELAEGVVHQGTQVIGWDPQRQQIRSWNFESDGAFGEGFWSRNGSEWLVRLAQTLADGRTASGTQVIEQIDDNEIAVQMIARQIDGEPVAATDPVHVVRVPADDQAANAPAKEGRP